MAIYQKQIRPKECSNPNFNPLVNPNADGYREYGDYTWIKRFIVKVFLLFVMLTFVKLCINIWL